MKKPITVFAAGILFILNLIYFSPAFAQGPPVFSQPNASGVPELPVIENTQWIIDGKTYAPVDVAIAKYHKDQLCIIKVVIDYMPSDKDQPLAKKFALHALKNGFFDRAKQNNVGSNFLPRMGVALMVPTGNGHHDGSRYQFTIEELEKEL